MKTTRARHLHSHLHSHLLSHHLPHHLPRLLATLCALCILHAATIAKPPASTAITAPTTLDTTNPDTTNPERPERRTTAPPLLQTLPLPDYFATTPPGTFTLPEKFSGLRPPPLLAGVTSEDYTLRLDLAPGRWICLAYLDDGYTNAHTIAITLNGETIPHNPRAFGLESEPATPPINRYRVAQFPIHSTANTPAQIRFRQPAPGGARLLTLRLLPIDWPETEITRWLRRQIDDAGRHPFRAPIDILRAELARNARRAPELAAPCAYWKTQLDLLAEAERLHREAGWDEVSLATRSSMFIRYKIAVSLLDPLVDHPDADRFPLRDRARWLRARLLYWLWQEQHHEGDNTAYQADIAILRQKYPDDKLIAMYAGEKIPAENKILPSHPAAPAWSSTQYEALQRLRDVAHYWIDERQIPNGEFGGKTDDDVELLRWWPVLMFSGDTKVRDGFRRLADGMWFSPKIHLGYCAEPRDVEHSAEYVSDTLPMMALLTRDPGWIARLAHSHEHMRDLWTGINANGDRHFKSAWFSSTEILSAPPRNRDLGMNTRAAKTVRYYSWLTADPAATRLLHDWSLAWAKAAARTDKNKPPGLFPASIRYPDAAINGDEPTWHRANMLWRYFDWAADGRLYDQLLFSWMQSAPAPTDRDPRLLQPMLDTLALLENNPKPAPTAPEGTPAWAAARLLGSEQFWNTVAQWRLETNDTRHDPLLKQHGPAYLRYRLTGDPTPLAPAIESTLLDALRYNRPLRTTEVLFTDRVYISSNNSRDEGANLLSAMLTGCHTAQGLSPYYHIAWENAPETFTALVNATAPDQVAADIYLHQNTPAKITARFLRLQPGAYRLTLTDPAGKLLLDRPETVTAPDHRATLEIPGATLATMKMANAGPPQTSRHKIALAAAGIILRDAVFAFRETPWRAPQGIHILEQQNLPVLAQSEFTLSESGTIHLGVGGTGKVEIQIDGNKVFSRNFETPSPPREYAYDRFRWPAGFSIPLAAGTHRIRVDATTNAFLQACDQHGETDSRAKFTDWTPAITRAPVRNFAVKQDAAFSKHSLVEWHYATGVTHLALIETADATNDPALRAHIDRFISFTLENLPWQREQYDNARAWRAANFRLFRGCLLDDTSAPALPIVELLRRGQIPATLAPSAAALAENILDFVLNKHPRLPDGTLCRDEPEPQTIWADDLFMSASFLIRMADWKKDPRIHDFVAKQALAFHRCLANPQTGLYWHGYYAAPDRKTPAAFHWARANGWMAWAMSEILRFLPPDHPDRAQLLAHHKQHLAALLRCQAPSGLWHQVLDKPESYEETSASAMFMLAMARGIKGGWLDPAAFAAPARRAWAGLQTRIAPDGVVRGICGGTAIGDSLDYYFNRPQLDHDPRGIGAYITAATLAGETPTTNLSRIK